MGKTTVHCRIDIEICILFEKYVHNVQKYSTETYSTWVLLQIFIDALEIPHVSQKADIERFACWLSMTTFKDIDILARISNLSC